jgi:phosphatidylglycerol lysyltransferase
VGKTIMLSSKRTWSVATSLAAVTLGSGILNLVSVMGGPTHPAWVGDIFPLEFIHFSRHGTLLIGFALIITSLNIYRRKSRAWLIAVALSCFSVMFHLLRGFHYGVALISVGLVVVLVFERKIFTVKSSAPDLLSGVVRLAVAAAVAVGYGVLGLWLLDKRHFGIEFHIGDSVITTWNLLTLAGDPRLIPLTHYGKWFLESMQMMAVVAVVYSGFALFRPVVYRFTELPRERALAASLVAEYGLTSLDYFKSWPDKSFFFTPSHKCVIAYGVSGNVALALADPVGEEDEIEPIVSSFLKMCHENGWTAGLHQVLPNYLNVYRRLGLKKLKIGDVALTNLKEFTLEGKTRKEFRYKIRQLEGLGYRTVTYERPLEDALISKLRAVSDEWLQIPGRRERKFTLGYFDSEYLRSTPVITVEDANANVFGFVNLISIEKRKQISVDLMRRRTEAPNGVMDYLFVKTFLWAQERGYEWFDLGMAPMAGFQDREEATAEERAIHSFFQQLNFLFSFQGLRQYKAKFATSWEPRYLMYRRVLDLPRLALALSKLSEVKEVAAEAKFE